jgi:hypothetical protein
LVLDQFVFSALPRLLLSTSQLVTLRLYSVPTQGYISPGSMAACLVALPNLKHVPVEFRCRGRDRDRLSSPLLPTRAVLHILISFHFGCTGQYLDDILSQIDAPVLRTFSAMLRDRFVRVLQLFRSISCAEKIGPPIQVVVKFMIQSILLTFMPLRSFELELERMCTDLILSRQVASVILLYRELSPRSRFL